MKHRERRDIQSDFLNELDKKAKEIRKSENVFVGADKSSNYYEMSKEHHAKLLLKAINKDYRKAPEGKVDEVNKGAKSLSDNLAISDKVFKLELKQSVITIKDHKPDYMNATQTRLINPTKSHLGRVGKIKLEELNKKVRSKTGLVQWKNTDSTIDWFKALEEKQNLSFLQFDIDSYYPSITPQLLDRALDWASELVNVSREDRELFHQTKDSLLYDRGTVWVKKGEQSFDVTMGSWDGAETCDIVGLFLLSQLKHLPVKLGLYRDDALGVSTLKAKENEALKKQISDTFKANGLSITIEVNKKVVSFLNVTFNLLNATYRDFCKDNHVPLYVHRESNHPPAVTKCIGRQPALVGKLIQQGDVRRSERNVPGAAGQGRLHGGVEVCAQGGGGEEEEKEKEGYLLVQPTILPLRQNQRRAAVSPDPGQMFSTRPPMPQGAEPSDSEGQLRDDAQLGSLDIGPQLEDHRQGGGGRQEEVQLP